MAYNDKIWHATTVDHNVIKKTYNPSSDCTYCLEQLYKNDVDPASSTSLIGYKYDESLIISIKW